MENAEADGSASRCGLCPPDGVGHPLVVKTRIPPGPIVVGIVVDAGILFMGYKDAHQPCGVDTFGAVTCRAPTGPGGLHVAYPIAAVLVMGVCLAIGIAVERPSGQSGTRRGM